LETASTIAAALRIATWNVNSVRSRLPRLVTWLAAHQPDIVCLQEIKCLDEQFPREAIADLGYHVETYGQKTYNGVALLARQKLDEVRRGLPGEDASAQRRLIAATAGDVRIVNVYVVNGEAPGSEKFAYKLAWMEELRRFLATYDLEREKVVVGGDLNVTFDDRDVHDPKRWHEQILCSSAERAALRRIVDLGLADAFRRFHEEGGHYTWWDFRTRAFERGWGLRIDHFLMSEPALGRCTGVAIDVEARRGEKPSDHAPVVATLR
jgi:exodeoxyribonuclease-3